MLLNVQKVAIDYPAHLGPVICYSGVSGAILGLLVEGTVWWFRGLPRVSFSSKFAAVLVVVEV